MNPVQRLVSRFRVAAWMVMTSALAVPPMGGAAHAQTGDGTHTMVSLPPGSDEFQDVLQQAYRFFEARLTSTGNWAVVGDAQILAALDEAADRTGASPTAIREAQLAAAQRGLADIAVSLSMATATDGFIVSVAVFEPRTGAAVFGHNEVVAESNAQVAARVGADLLAQRWLTSPAASRLLADRVITNGGALGVYDTHPSPVRVLINGQPAGLAPGQFAGLPTGPVRVTFEADGYASMVRDTDISPGQMVEIRGVQLEAALVPLTLVTDVAGATVLVDGQSVGQTTAGETHFDVPVSSGTLRVIRLGRQPFATLLSLSAASGQRVEFSMPELDGPDGQDTTTADCSRVGAVDRTRQCAVPSSEAPMGSDATWAPSDAGPERLVLLTRPFRIHRDEVSVGSYQRCVEAGACAAPGADTLVETSATNALCNWGQMGHADHPMNCISAMAAQNYCEWAGGSLPTEAQWERAARGTDGRLLPWALTAAESIIDPCQWMSTADCTSRASGTSAIGEFPDARSPYGLQDVLGNVSEWTADAYESDAYVVLPATDPVSDVGTSRRAVRGTSFVSVHGQDALIARSRIPSTATLSWIGFRCVFAD